VRTKVDSSGRVVIPAAVRRQLGIPEQGGEVELFDTPDGVLIRSAAAPALRRDELGLMVVELGRPVTAQEVAAAIDSDRARTRD
jgi:AbrB family looped-hinge helix DNA binding protein